MYVLDFWNPCNKDVFKDLIVVRDKLSSIAKY